MTVHFVYNKGLSLKTPERILHELSIRLARHHRLQTYAINEQGVIKPEAGDILIGHPSRFSESSIFNRSMRQAGWAKRIVFCPFSHGLPLDAAGIDPLMELADQYLALCGPYWFETVGQSLLSHWEYKMWRCDLGVNQSDYPPVKTSFNPPGKRRFLYIGNAGPMKGGDIFAALAKANPDMDFGWIGWTGDAQCPAGTLLRDYRAIERRLCAGRVTVHGGSDWRNNDHVSIAANYDFLLTCGRSDSNPTTILEASAWGLIPVAPLSCGYYGDDWLVNIPIDDLGAASNILRKLNHAPGAELLDRQRAGYRQLDSHYTWDNAAQQVLDCIAAPIPVEPADADWHARKSANQAALRTLIQRYNRAKQGERLVQWPRQTARRLLRRIA